MPGSINESAASHRRSGKARQLFYQLPGDRRAHSSEPISRSQCRATRATKSGYGRRFRRRAANTGTHRCLIGNFPQAFLCAMDTTGVIHPFLLAGSQAATTARTVHTPGRVCRLPSARTRRTRDANSMPADDPAHALCVKVWSAPQPAHGTCPVPEQYLQGHRAGALVCQGLQGPVIVFGVPLGLALLTTHRWAP